MADNLTGLEKTKKAKRELAEDIDYLKEVDKLDGYKFVEQYEKDKARKEKKVTDNKLNSLQGTGTLTYLGSLASYGKELLKGIDFPQGWEHDCISTSSMGVRIYGKWFKSQEGILVIMKSADGKVFVKGIRTCFDPVVDTGALKMLMEQVENTIDSAKGILLSDRKDPMTGLPKTKSGILLPN